MTTKKAKVNPILSEALDEFRGELNAGAKALVKEQLRAKREAQRVLANIEAKIAAILQDAALDAL